MADVQMGLGDFRFGIDTASWQSLRKEAAFRWASQPRLGRVPALQFLGPDTESITVTGAIYPFHRGGLGQIDQIKALAGKGEPLALVDGLGHALGQWVIESAGEDLSIPAMRGIARKIDFSVTLKFYGADGVTGLYSAPGVFKPRTTKPVVIKDGIGSFTSAAPGRSMRGWFGMDDADVGLSMDAISSTGIDAADTSTMLDHLLGVGARAIELAGVAVPAQVRRAADLIPGSSARLAAALSEIGVTPTALSGPFRRRAVDGILTIGDIVAASADAATTSRRMLPGRSGDRLAIYAGGIAAARAVVGAVS